ncbi:hypothetical protein HK096_009929, partial [Nowakowskiella sp. JEL0078]
MRHFDVPVLIIIFTDGFSWKRLVPCFLILHWIFRSLGGILCGIIMFAKQNQNEFDPLHPYLIIPPGWRWKESMPSIFYYL